MPLLVIPYPALDPVLVHLGPFAIRWYALAYILGILIGWAYARGLIRSEKLWGGKSRSSVAPSPTSCSMTFPTSSLIQSKSGNCGTGACHSTADLSGVFLQSCCSDTTAAFQSSRLAISPAPSDQSVYFSAASPISSTANCGVVPRT